MPQTRSASPARTLAARLSSSPSLPGLASFVTRHRADVDRMILRTQRRAGLVKRKMTCDLDRTEMLARIPSLRAWVLEAMATEAATLPEYPFEITLPLWTAPSEERPGVPFLALLSVPEVIEAPAFFRTYRCRLEFWGGCDPGRLAAVYQGQDGLHHVEKNPYTLALLREALGLSRPAATLSLNFEEERYEVTDEAGAIVSFDSSEKIARETAEEAGYEVSWPRP